MIFLTTATMFAFLLTPWIVAVASKASPSGNASGLAMVMPARITLTVVLLLAIAGIVLGIILLVRARRQWEIVLCLVVNCLLFLTVAGFLVGSIG